ncbi:MAG: CPBP family intramembrane glutamic endopeptidase [Halobacteriota archaeon]|nr:CPBP family intramembrane glutamic endopeptidase [Halobacteriota archaeon]
MLVLPSLAMIIIGELLIYFQALSTGIMLHAINLNALIFLIVAMRNSDTSILRKRILSDREKIYEKIDSLVHLGSSEKTFDLIYSAAEITDNLKKFEGEENLRGDSDRIKKQLIQSLLLLLQLRIINVAMPIFFTITLYWYPLIYSPLFISIYILIRNQGMTLEEIGFTTRHIFLYMPVAVLIGFFMAFIEYWIIDPPLLLMSPSIANITVLIIIMFVFVGAIEELIFRSILQTRLEGATDGRMGLIITSFIFGIMHSGYGLISEIIFTMVVGVILGYLFQRTRSLPLVIAIHGTVNVFLFGFIPYLPA